MMGGITFNTVLVDGGIDPAGVLLLRHTVAGVDALGVWRTERARFEGYQREQLPDAFRGASHAASFIVDHARREVFTGLYTIGGSSPTPVGYVNPLTGAVTAPADLGRYVQHDLQHVPDFALYEDRLVIAWGAGTRTWRQWAGRNPKPIVELATQAPPPFPGWLAFTCPVDDLDTLPPTWREVLRSSSGIYLLTDGAGKHYVGSAKGGDGFLGRWDGYRGGRSGGNVGLAADSKPPFTASVLQTFDASTPDQTIEAVESLWKRKLGARLVGLNRN
jgi:hypothetical protein